jgi:asparagine synthase (glutamine-hydrolysing)
MAAGTALLPAGEPKTWSYRVRRFVATLADSPFERFARWSSVFDAAMRQRLTRGRFTAASESLLSPFFVGGGGARSVEAAVRADVHLYLPDDLLVKMDIASMAHSLEVRSPFLDHEIVEFAASLPLSLKLRGKTLKYLLRKAFADLLPSAILARPKMGFGVPIDRWFRNDLRELAYDVLLDSRAVGRGYFEPAELHRYLDEHSSGRAHHHHRLWALLILELWHRLFIDRRCTVEPPSDLGSTESAPQIDAAAVHASP